MTQPRVSQPIRVTPQSRIMAWLGEIPTTQVRVLVTLIVVLGTAVRYTASGLGQIVPWEPSWDWLAFMAVMSGLDAAQFFAKRKTDAAYVAAQQGTPAPPDPDPPSPTT